MTIFLTKRSHSTDFLKVLVMACLFGFMSAPHGQAQNIDYHYKDQPADEQRILAFDQLEGFGYNLSQSVAVTSDSTLKITHVNVDALHPWRDGGLYVIALQFCMSLGKDSPLAPNSVTTGQTAISKQQLSDIVKTEDLKKFQGRAMGICLDLLKERTACPFSGEGIPSPDAMVNPSGTPLTCWQQQYLICHHLKDSFLGPGNNGGTGQSSIMAGKGYSGGVANSYMFNALNDCDSYGLSELMAEKITHLQCINVSHIENSANTLDSSSELDTKVNHDCMIEQDNWDAKMQAEKNNLTREVDIIEQTHHGGW
jgi:hypothetical protein